MPTPIIDRSAWTIADGVTYLNHGSFGPSPRVVQAARERWTARLESQPMQFFVRDMEGLLDEAADALASFVGTSADNLAFVDNATFGMNVVARTVPLGPGDEVLLTDHEYGAVMNIWRARCKETGAEMVVRRLPDPLQSADEVVARLMEGVTDRTKLIVVSHVTSQTAAELPVAAICRAARARKVPVAIDGPHALAMTEVNLDRIDCDFYCVSCHKWLCAPFGSGFLYVAPRWQQRVRPALVSWGGSVSGRPPRWQDAFNWIGTRDPAPFLAVPDAIRFLTEFGLDRFREQTHALTQTARQAITELTGLEPLLPDSPEWYGSMIALPIPGEVAEGEQHGRRDPLQVALWERDRIEVPVYSWKQHRFLRVSCHLYNTPDDVQRLVDALRRELRSAR